MTAKKIFFLTAAVFYLLIFVFISRDPNFGGDFLSYYTGAEIIKTGHGDRLYDIALQKKVQENLVPLINIELLPFRSLPFVGIFFIPFTFISFSVGSSLFTLFNILLLFFILLLIKKMFPHLKDPVLLGLVGFGYLPNVHALFSGQLSFVLCLLFLLIFIALKDKRSFITGILCGLILIKPQYIIAVPFIFFLSKKRYFFFMGFLVTTIIISLINISIIGLDLLIRYPQFAFVKTAHEMYGNIPWQAFTFYALLKSIPFLTNFNNLIFMFNILSYFMCFIFFIRDIKRGSLERSFLFIMLVAVVFSIHALAHDLVIFLLPIFMLLNKAYVLKNGSTSKVVNLLIATVLFVLMLFLTLPALFWGNINLGTVVILLILISFYKFKDFILPKNLSGK